MGSLPSGTVTFAFTDVEGSTELLERLGDEYAGLLAEHRRIVREAVAAHGGEIVDARGEEFFAAFARAPDAAAAAVAVQRRHAEGPIRVRIGLHTGTPAVSDEGYLGLDVHRAARICAAGHGGQILLSDVTRELLTEADARDLGEHALKGISKPERLFQFLAPGLRSRFPPLRAESAGPTRLARFSRLRGRRAPTIEELAWQVRGRMVGADDSMRTALAELGACLFAASRTGIEAERLMARTDRRLLQRRLREHEELGTLSRRAREKAAEVQAQLDLLDDIVGSARALSERAARAREAATVSAATALTERLTEASMRLDELLSRAQAEIGDEALRLRRTRYPGVRRAGNAYAVPSIDEAGIESVPLFETFREARAYWRAQRLREKTFSASVVERERGDAVERRDRRMGGRHDSGSGGSGGSAGDPF